MVDLLGALGQALDRARADRAEGLCPRGRLRAGMTDDEFWADVEDLRGIGALPILDPGLQVDFDDEPDPGGPSYPDPCSECGEVGACAYDAEGRSLVHVQRKDDDA